MHTDTGSADRIKDHSSLEVYLREEEDREQRLLRGDRAQHGHHYGSTATYTKLVFRLSWGYFTVLVICG